MNKKNIFIITLIFIVAVIFRLLMLDKTGGLWYDELVSYKQASQPGVIETIIYTLKTDVHLPLYQIFLHLWCKVFSFSDISMRGFSAFCGIITVLAAFFAGKNLKDRECGIICSIIFGLNSFLIYYSQEVRMYSFLLMLVTLNLFYVINIRKNPIIRNYIGLAITSFAIIHTYTICIIYVIGLLTALFVYFLKNNKENLKNYLITLAILFLSCIPMLLFLIINHSKYATQINGFYCDWSSLFVFIQNIFTPVLIGLSDNPEHYVKYFILNYSISSLIFITIPIMIFLYGFVNAIKKDKFSLIILSGSFMFLLAEIIAFKTTNFKILSRYLSACIPAILLVSGYGLAVIDKNIKKIILSILIVINMTYLIFSNEASYKLERSGFKPLAEMVNSLNPGKSDFIIVWNRHEVLDKYVKTDANILGILKDFAYKSEVMLMNEKALSAYSIEKRKDFLYPYFKDNKMPYNTYLLMTYITEKMTPGQRFIVTTTENFDNYDKESFRNLVEHEYSSASLNDLLTIKSLLDIKLFCNINFQLVEILKQNGFVVIVYKKL